MTILLLRGAFRVIASVSGLLIVYGIIYAMEAMTSRVPVGLVREVMISTFWMLPWTMLLCSGFDDFAKVAKRPWVFWSGCIAVLVLVYYLDRFTTVAAITKAGVPLLACIVAVLPHVFRRISFVYIACSILFAICGFVALARVFQTFWSPTTSFASGAIAAVNVLFAVTAIGGGVLSLAPRFHITRAITT